VFEVRFGLARLAGGRRRQGLEEAFAALLRKDLAGRVARRSTVQPPVPLACLQHGARRLGGRWMSATP